MGGGSIANLYDCPVATARPLCSTNWGGPILDSMLIYVFKHLSLIRGVHLPARNMHCPRCSSWCSGIQGMYGQFTGEDLSLFYIYKDAV